MKRPVAKTISVSFGSSLFRAAHLLLAILAFLIMLSFVFFCVVLGDSIIQPASPAATSELSSSTMSTNETVVQKVPAAKTNAVVRFFVAFVLGAFCKKVVLWRRTKPEVKADWGVVDLAQEV